MGFWKQTLPPGISQVDLDRSRKLETVVRIHRKLQTKPTDWNSTFAKLRSKYGDVLLDKVLSWYVEHFNQPFVPKAFSATSFGKKFKYIQQAMERDPSKEIAISPEVMRLHSDLDLVWPNDEDKEELAFLQASLDNYSRYCSLLLKKSEGGNVPEPDARLLKYVYSIQQIDAIEFVKGHAREVNEIAWHWEKWSGHLHSWSWNFDNKRWAESMRSIIQEWCGDPGVWERVRELLHEG